MVCSEEPGADLESRAAYLSGLVQGLELESGRPEGRVLEQVVELLGAIVRELVELREGRAGGPGFDGPTRSEERDLFLACECPYCGKDIFVNASPAGRETGSTGGLQEVVLTCTRCGEKLHVILNTLQPRPHRGPSSDPPLDPHRHRPSRGRAH